MAGLKEIRTRIGSIKTTRQVTSAMKMVSAAKLKKAQDLVNNFWPYAKKYQTIFTSVVAAMDSIASHPLFTIREPSRILIVMISSNRGLCGGFNGNVTNAALELAEQKYQRQLSQGKVHFLAIGKQGERLLNSCRMKITGNMNHIFDTLTFANVSAVCDQITGYFLKGTYDRIELVFNEFINAAQHEPRKVMFLPLPCYEENRKKLRGDIIFEPSPAEISEEILFSWLRIHFYQSLLLSWAAEHGARMTAMHQATDNATELLGELTLQYNKERQASITKEILEITGGAEALRS